MEILAGVRRAVLQDVVGPRRAAELIEDYRDLPLTRHGHVALLERMFDLRRNVSAYEATYLALAEMISGALLTTDRLLSEASRAHSDVEILP